MGRGKNTNLVEMAGRNECPGVADERVLAEVLGEKGYLSMMVCDCPHIMENGYYFDRGFDGFEWIRGQESDRWMTHPEAPPHPCDPAMLRRGDGIQQRHRRNIAGRRFEKETFVARTMTAAAEWLEHNYRRDKFFLSVDTFDPHEPWDAPQWYVDMYDPGYKGEIVDYPHYAYVDGYLSEAELNHCRALYAGEVTLVDRWVRMLFHRISDLGLLKDTLVIFTSDHGYLFGEHSIMGKALISEGKQVLTYIPLYEEIGHVPFLVHCPGAKPGRSGAIVQPTVIMPTLVELSGADDPGTMHGRSIASVLEGESHEHLRFAVSAPYLGSDPCPVTVAKGNWSATLYAGEGTEGVLVDRAVDGYVKMQDRSGGVFEDALYTLDSDPNREHDTKSQHPGVLVELRADLISRLAEVGTAPEILDRWR